MKRFCSIECKKTKSEKGRTSVRMRGGQVHYDCWFHAPRGRVLQSWLDVSPVPQEGAGPQEGPLVSRRDSASSGTARTGTSRRILSGQVRTVASRGRSQGFWEVVSNESWKFCGANCVCELCTAIVEHRDCAIVDWCECGVRSGSILNIFWIEA